MSTMTQSENEIDISPMLKDINAVLKGHLSSLLGPIINEKNAIQSVLLNMPYVKRLKAENEVLRRHVFQLTTELETNKKIYKAKFSFKFRDKKLYYYFCIKRVSIGVKIKWNFF